MPPDEPTEAQLIASLGRTVDDAADVVFVVDGAVRDRAQWIIDVVGRRHAHVVEWQPSSTHLSIDVVRELASALRAVPDARTVVGIGGGQTLDAVKLATAPERLFTLLSVKGRRSGLVVCPPFRRNHAVILVPTTIGTGAETSTSALVSTADGNLLVVGHSLLPDSAVRDASLLQSLTPDMVRDGAIEVMLRLIGPVIGDSETQLVAARAALLDVCMRALDGSGRGDLSQLAIASARSHIINRTTLSTPYPMRHWYVANELSFLTGASKMTITRSLVPLVWARIEHGVMAWGDPSALARVWQCVRERGAPSLSERASAGIAELMGSPGEAPWRQVDPSLIVDRCLQRWGRRLPMLADIDADELLSTVTASGSVAHGR